MTENPGYGQFCPVAVAAEIIAERWTPLVLRALFCGATRFGEIQASVPRMSSALLSRRLKDLEQANIVERRKVEKGKGFEYFLTPSGSELFPVLNQMGNWAQKWLRREIISDKNLDPDVLFWELRRNILADNYLVEQRRVVEFQLQGVPADRRFYWLVFERGDVDICVKNPGYDVNLWVNSKLRTLVELWLGHRKISAAIDDDSLQLDGDAPDVDAFSNWFTCSHFAKVGELPPAVPN